MKKNTLIALLSLSLLGLAVAFYLLRVFDCGASLFCHSLITRAFAVYYGMGALSLIFFILLFTPHAVPAWKKFAIWFVPLAAILFAVYPQPGAWDFLSPDPETLFKWVSGLYVVISLAIIAVATLKSRK